MKYCRFIDWRRLQHYKNRAPVWFKAYTCDRTEIGNPWLSLNDAQRGQLATLRMLAADMGNCIPYDPEFIAEEIQASDPVDLGAFGDFLAVYPSKRACMEAEQLASRSASNIASENASGSASNIAIPEGEEEEDQNQRKKKIRKEGGTRARDPKKAKGRGRIGSDQNQESPRFSKANEDQEGMLNRIAAERGLDITSSAAAAGVGWPITGTPSQVSQSVTKLKVSMKREPEKLAEKVERMRHRMDLDARWDTIEPLLHDPEMVSVELLSLNRADPTAARCLLDRLNKWVELQTGRHLGSVAPIGSSTGLWDIVENLTNAYRDLGLIASDAVGEAAANA